MQGDNISRLILNPHNAGNVAVFCCTPCVLFIKLASNSPQKVERLKMSLSTFAISMVYFCMLSRRLMVNIKFALSTIFSEKNCGKLEKRTKRYDVLLEKRTKRYNILLGKRTIRHAPLSEKRTSTCQNI